MSKPTEATLNQMVSELEAAGQNCGYMSANHVVWIRGPGSPYTDTPTLFTEEDLTAAIESGLLLEAKMLGNGQGWTYYVLV
jgi:hypothetical protein